jgi:hypothetical protein
MLPNKSLLARAELRRDASRSNRAIFDSGGHEASRCCSVLNSRKIVLEDAQQELSSLVDALRRDGGRIDVVVEGEAVVSLVRTSDLQDMVSVSVVDEPPAPKGAAKGVAPATARPLLQRARKRKPRRIV